MDGGVRSIANADLLEGFESVALVCFHPPGLPGERIRARVAAQVEQLRNAGAAVTVVFPDEAVLAAIGPRTMDVTRRPSVVRAALAQGAMVRVISG